MQHRPVCPSRADRRACRKILLNLIATAIGSPPRRPGEGRGGPTGWIVLTVPRGLAWPVRHPRLGDPFFEPRGRGGREVSPRPVGEERLGRNDRGAIAVGRPPARARACREPTIDSARSDSPVTVPSLSVPLSGSGEGRIKVVVDSQHGRAAVQSRTEGPSAQGVVGPSFSRSTWGMRRNVVAAGALLGPFRGAGGGRSGS